MPIYTLSISHSFPIYIYTQYIPSLSQIAEPGWGHGSFTNCCAHVAQDLSRPATWLQREGNLRQRFFLYNGTDSQILGLGVSMSWSLGFKRKQISKQPPFYFLPQSIHGSGTAVIRCDKSLNPNFNAWQHATHTVLAIMKRFEVIWSK